MGHLTPDDSVRSAPVAVGGEVVQLRHGLVAVYVLREPPPPAADPMPDVAASSDVPPWLRDDEPPWGPVGYPPDYDGPR